MFKFTAGPKAGSIVTFACLDLAEFEYQDDPAKFTNKSFTILEDDQLMTGSILGHGKTFSEAELLRMQISAELASPPKLASAVDHEGEILSLSRKVDTLQAQVKSQNAQISALKTSLRLIEKTINTSVSFEKRVSFFNY